MGARLVEDRQRLGALNGMRGANNNEVVEVMKDVSNPPLPQTPLRRHHSRASATALKFLGPSKARMGASGRRRTSLPIPPLAVDDRADEPV